MPIGYQPKDALKAKRIFLLLNYLQQEPSFLKWTQDLKGNYHEVISKNWKDIKNILTIYKVLPQHTELGTESSAYLEELYKLVNHYRLNLDWSLEALHNMLKFAHPGRPATVTWREQNREYTIKWVNDPLLSKEEHKNRILRQFEDQWRQEEEKLYKEDGLVKSRKHSSLEMHMRWVFKRVCLGRSWRQIAEEEFVTSDSIRSSTKPIIDSLGLQSARLKGGRQKK